MKRIVAVIALACAAVVPAACGPQGESAAETPPTTAEAASDAASTELAATTPPSAAAATAPAGAGAAAPAAPDAPPFAVLYPAATLDAPAVVATGPTGPGGLATYSTEAAPEAVIAFHRERAEAAGLTSTMEMNQGEARAYGATSRDGGKTLQVVASATDDGPTSVQLTWSGGR